MSRFPEDWKKKKAILCHDWLTGMRGGERVLEILCEGFPAAPIFTLFHNQRAMSGLINSRSIWTSWLQGVPGIFRLYRYMLPLFPSAITMMTPPPADLLISTSHCVAKGLRIQPGTKHLCYCFTPMRYAWTFYDEYFGKSTAKTLLAKALLPWLRHWDLKTSKKVDRFVAISDHVKERIRQFYGRDADVVYPPVDLDRWTPGSAPRSGEFDLIVSALVPYKKIELAVAVYTETGRALKIVGIGSETAKLREKAGRNIEFLGWLPDEKILELYRNARLLVFPGEEDFGIVPVEAMACGCPVVAYAKGGVSETVQEGKSGIFFATQTTAALKEAVEKACSTKWDHASIRASVQRFDVQHFIDGMADSVRKCLAGS